MGDLYTEITAARTAAGVLWSPALSLDHLGNVWGMGAVMDCVVPIDTVPGVASPTWSAPRHSFDVYLPPDWALDDEFDPDLEIRLAVEFNVTARTAGASDAEIRLATSTVDGTSTGAITTTGWTSHSFLTWTSADIEEGRLGVDIEVLPPGTGGSITYERGSSAGPTGRLTCYLHARISP